MEMQPAPPAPEIGAPVPGYSFALLISGPGAPCPAPRCLAVSAEYAGVYVPEIGDILRPDYQSLRDALPPRYRRYAKREHISLWYDSGARFDGKRTIPSLPYFQLYNAREQHVATVYAALVKES